MLMMGFFECVYVLYLPSLIKIEMFQTRRFLSSSNSVYRTYDAGDVVALSIKVGLWVWTITSIWDLDVRLKCLERFDTLKKIQQEVEACRGNVRV